MNSSLKQSSRVLTLGRPGHRLSHYLWPAAIGGSAILLVGVALLQYRWNAEIRATTEVRLGADLESVMLKWDLNLYRELSTICIALQVGPDSGAHAHWTDFLHRYQQWRNTSDVGMVRNIYSNPYVVRDLYVYETSRASGASLLRLDPDSDQIQRTGEPPELEALLARLEKRSGNLRTALRAWESESPFGNAATDELAFKGQGKLSMNVITGWQFDESIPAIVHPILHNGRRASSPKSPVDWLVIVLNNDAITNRILPELTQQYFEGGRWSEYDVTVMSVGKGASRLLYASKPEGGTANVQGSDSVMNIFGPPPESTEGSFWQVVKNRESLTGDEWRSFSGPVWFPVFQSSSDSRRWMLFLKHRTGSLQASVTKVWYANLAIGVAMLLLLAITLVLVITATRRVHSLAAMQMDFVASISHELRTPLAAMLCAGQNLSDGIARDLSQYGSMITAQANQLIDLVDQIVLFVAAKNSRKTLDLKPVSVYEVVDKLEKTNFAVLRRAGFEIECRIQEELPCVLADQQALLRCLRNLIDNAAKYSGSSRWIGLFAELHSRSENQEIGISVVDRGIGIAASELTHIFDPFYRSRAVTATQVHGSGLGLAIVNHIVKELGGRLSVNSEPNLGSAFTLRLQVAAQASSLQHQGSHRSVVAD
jgi:signal transduction histidine kinase